EPHVLIDQSRSGGHLMYDFAVAQGWLKPTPAWERLCHYVERYDLWKPQHDFGQDLNRLFHDLGYDWYRRQFSAGYAALTPEDGERLAQLIRDEAVFVKRHLALAVRYHEDLPFPIYAVRLEEEGPVNIVSHTLIEQGAALVITLKPEHKLSARSDARVDAASLMEALYQGGGHARAAGGRLQAGQATDPEALLQEIAHYLKGILQAS
ncbi:MAG: DHHA1 domain-containing protein, partial [Firmicutes bacterium]|nr:DHHA1 domain-containing protein [Bacillota bacterium]